MRRSKVANQPCLIPIEIILFMEYDDFLIDDDNLYEKSPVLCLSNTSQQDFAKTCTPTHEQFSGYTERFSSAVVLLPKTIQPVSIRSPHIVCSEVRWELYKTLDSQNL